jgi:hypothetical protein
MSARTLIFLALDQAANASPGQPFATLLPAFDEKERDQAKAVAVLLLEQGCAEFCCVGPEAELLHDSIDAIVESKGALRVVTTWHTDWSDASEYFLFAAGSRASTLLAVVGAHPGLVAMLENEAASV